MIIIIQGDPIHAFTNKFFNFHELTNDILSVHDERNRFHEFTKNPFPISRGRRRLTMIAIIILF